MGVAVSFVVAGRLVGSLELFVLGAVAGILVLGAAIYTGALRVSVNVDRELHPPRVHAGTPSRVDLRVQNQGSRRSPVLGLLDDVSGTRGAQLAVGPLAPGAAARAAYRLPTERRGVLVVGPLRVVMSDPFGFTRLTMTASGVSELTVYPQVDDVTPIPLTTGADPLAGASHPTAIGRTGDDFYALRPYQVGDDLRRVHWPATARHDQLMVRQDELPWQARATVLLDLRASATSAASIEAAVSAAASLVMASARRQDLIRLVVSDGSDSGFAAGHAHIEAILEHLAAADVTGDAGFGPLLDRLARTTTGGSLVALVSRPPAVDIEMIGRLRKRFSSAYLVRFDLDPGPMPAPSSAAARVPSMVVDAGHPFAEVWNAAMGSKGGAHVPRWRPESLAETDDDRWSAHARILS